MDNYDIIVVGGGYSGLTAIDRLARRNLGAKLLLIDSKPTFVERIRLHEVAAGRDRRIFAYEPHLSALGADFIQARVTGIDARAARLEIAARDGRVGRIAYRQLVLALGSRTDATQTPGVVEHAFRLDGPDEVAGLAQWAESGGGRLVVVGGGLTAIEAACEFAERFGRLDVTILSGGVLAASDAPGGYNAAAVAHLRRTFERLNIRFRERARVLRVEDGRAILERGEAVPFDRCIWCGGFSASDLPARAGMKVDAVGRVVCATTLQSASHPQIVATGDSALVVADPGGPCRMSCAAGRPMGEAAAATAAALLKGEAPPEFHFAYTFRCISLGREDGVIQFVDVTDRPTQDVWTGARAARWKEYVCRRTVAGVGLTEDVAPPDTPPTALNSQMALEAGRS